MLVCFHLLSTLVNILFLNSIFKKINTQISNRNDISILVYHFVISEHSKLTQILENNFSEKFCFKVESLKGNTFMLYL